MTFTDDQLASLNANPLYHAIGIHVEAVGEGRGRSMLRPEAAVCWPTQGRPHGGILFTLLDTTMAFAAISNGVAGTGCATVDCNIQYTAPADHGPFLCEVDTTSKTSRTVFIRGQIKDRNGSLVALAQATFRLMPPRQP